MSEFIWLQLPGSADLACHEKFLTVNNKRVEVKKAAVSSRFVTIVRLRPFSRKFSPSLKIFFTTIFFFTPCDICLCRIQFLSRCCSLPIFANFRSNLLLFRHPSRGSGKKNKDPSFVSSGLSIDANQNNPFFSFDQLPQPTYVRIGHFFGWLHLIFTARLLWYRYVGSKQKVPNCLIGVNGK